MDNLIHDCFSYELRPLIRADAVKLFKIIYNKTLKMWIRGPTHTDHTSLGLD